MAYSKDVTSTITDSTATDIPLAMLDTVMPDSSAANAQAIALTLMQDNGDGTFTAIGFVGPGSPDINTFDYQVDQMLDGIYGQLVAISGIVNEAGFAPQLIGLLTIDGATTVKELTDDTETPLFPARDPADGSRIDLSNVIITNKDTAEIEVSFICGGQVTPVIVEPRKTLPLTNVIRGEAADTGWTVQLSAIPGAAVVITAGARYAAAGL